MTLHYNQIAKGHNNLTGLVNLENVTILERYFPPMNDRFWDDGQLTKNGNGIVVPRGQASTIWQASYLSDAQYWYLRTQYLNGNVSGPVTIRTHKLSVPTATGMIEQSIIANATLTLTKQSEGNRYDSGDGYQPIDLIYTEIEEIMSGNFYGDIYVTGGAVSQDDIGTTAVKLTAFDTDGENNGVTVSNSGDSLTVLVTAKYLPRGYIQFTSVGAATEWTFIVYKNGAATDIVRTAKVTVGFASLNGIILDLTANDVLTVYVKSDDGTALSDITVVEGVFGVESVSLE